MKRFASKDSNDSANTGVKNRAKRRERPDLRVMIPSTQTSGRGGECGSSHRPGRGASETGCGMALSFDGEYAVVLTPNGGFERVKPCLADGEPARGNIVGREVYYRRAVRPAAPSRISVGLRAACAVAAAFLFLVMGVFRLWGPLAPGRAYAYVYVDINPSVEMLVDAQSRVIRVKACDPESASLVSALGRVRGKNVEDVTRTLVEAAVDLGVIGAEGAGKGSSDAEAEAQDAQEKGEGSPPEYPDKSLIVITISPVGAGDRMEGLETRVATIRDVVEEELRSRIDLSEVVITAALLPREVRESALDAGVPPGRYALWLQAASQGVEVQAREMATGSMTKVLKKAGADPEKIAKDVAANTDLGALLKKVKEKEAGAPNGRQNGGGHREAAPGAPDGGRVTAPAYEGSADKRTGFTGPKGAGGEDDSDDDTRDKEKREEKPGGKGESPEPTSEGKAPVPPRTPGRIRETTGDGDDDEADDESEGNRGGERDEKKEGGNPRPDRGRLEDRLKSRIRPKVRPESENPLYNGYRYDRLYDWKWREIDGGADEKGDGDGERDEYGVGSDEPPDQDEFEDDGRN